MVRLGGRVGGARPGRKVLTLVTAILAGATHIDHADRLRAGATQSVLPFRVMAPSTLGTFLRAFTFGHIRQLDAVIAESIRRAWSLGAGPGVAPDDHRSRLDDLSRSTARRSRAPPMATPTSSATTRSSPPGPRPVRCSTPGCARDPPSAATSDSSKNSSPGCAGPGRPARSACVPIRASSSYTLIDTLVRLGVAYSITVNINAQVRACIDAIDRVGVAHHRLSRRRGGPGRRDDVRRPAVRGQRAQRTCVWSCAAPG